MKRPIPWQVAILQPATPAETADLMEKFNAGKQETKMGEYFSVEQTGNYHTVTLDVARAFNDGKLGTKFSGTLGAGQVVSAAGTIGRKPLSDQISMSVEPMGDGTFAINDAETTIYASFDDAVAAAKLALIAEFK